MSEDFTAIYDLYKDAIFRYCLSKSGNCDTGQDLMQETFLRFWICLRRKQKILHMRAFLYRIAHNLFVSHIRRKKEASLDQLLETGYEPATDPWQTVHVSLDIERPLRALHTMQPSATKVLHQRFVLGLALSEIAMLNGESANAVSVRMFRGLKCLRRSLNKVSQGTPAVPLALPAIL